MYNFRNKLFVCFSMLAFIWSAQLQADNSPETGYGGFLGIKLAELSEFKAETLGFDNNYGAYVKYVYPASPADQAGIQIFDYIIEVNGSSLKKNRRLSDALSDFDPGDKVSLSFIRNGVVKNAKVILVRRDDVPTPAKVSEQEHAFLGVKPSSKYDYDRSKGVKVNIVSESSASEMGLEDGDVIYALDGYRMVDWDDISILMDSKRGGEKLEVVFFRNGKRNRVSGKLRAHADTAYEYSYTVKTSSPKMSKGVFLGVNSAKMSATKAEKMGLDNAYGFYVESAIKGSTAEKYGFMPMDYIYGVDDHRVSKDQSFGNILSKYEAGQTGAVHIIRQGKAKVIDVIFEKRTSYSFDFPMRNACERPFLGVEQAPNVIDVGLDVFVVEGSPADALGLKDKDAITKVNDHYIIDWSDLKLVHSIYKPGDKMKIEVLRDGSKKTFNSTFTSYKDAKDCEDCDCDQFFEIDLSGEMEEVKIELREISEEIRKELEDLRIEIELNEKEVREMERVKKAEIIIKELEEREMREALEILESTGSSGDLVVKEFTLKSIDDSAFYGIHFLLDSMGDLNLKVASDDGRVIYDFESTDFKGVFEDRIDLAQENDTYFFLIKQDGKHLIKKVQLN